MTLKNSIVQLLLAAAPLGSLAHPHGDKEPLHAAIPLPRGLHHCHAKFAEQDLYRRTAKRHVAEVDQLKKERGLEHLPTVHKRQWGGFPGMGGGAGGGNAAEILAKDHEETDMDVDMDTDPASLFEDAGACVLSPEVTEGPLYVKGEEIRKDLTEGEGGVKMRIAVQVVDMETCEPVPETWIDMWSCNSTGVYGGVLNYPANGDPNDLSLVNVTTLRGVQPTDEDGIAVFDTLVPGHYQGRTNHVHAMVHHDVTVESNGTITGGRVSHVGQMYFDQSLLEKVEETSPYASNDQQWTQNAVDFLFTQGTGGGDDPVVRYALLGDDVDNGIYAWIRFGVDVDAARRFNPAAYLDEEGGHMSEVGFGAGMGGGFPGFGGGGGVPKE